MIEKKRI